VKPGKIPGKTREEYGMYKRNKQAIGESLCMNLSFLLRNYGGM